MAEVRSATAMALRAEGARWISGLLLFAMFTASAARLSWDLPDPRSLASKIRVHPRGNLWATGKSLGSASAPHLALTPFPFSDHPSAIDISVGLVGTLGLI